jgi:hypothetical protein
MLNVNDIFQHRFNTDSTQIFKIQQKFLAKNNKFLPELSTQIEHKFKLV